MEKIEKEKAKKKVDREEKKIDKEIKKMNRQEDCCRLCFSLAQHDCFHLLRVVSL